MSKSWCTVFWSDLANLEVLHVSHATRFKPRHWCFLGLASAKTWWNGGEPQGILSPRQRLTYSSVTVPTRYFQRQLRKGGSNYHFPSSVENKKILINTILGSHPLCVYDRSCQWYETENLAQTPRSAVVQPYRGGGSDTVKTEEHPAYKNSLYSGEGKT